MAGFALPINTNYKVSCASMQKWFKYISTKYFISHGVHVMNLWVAPMKNHFSPDVPWNRILSNLSSHCIAKCIELYWSIHMGLVEFTILASMETHSLWFGSRYTFNITDCNILSPHSQVPSTKQSGTTLRRQIITVIAFDSEHFMLIAIVSQYGSAVCSWLA